MSIPVAPPANALGPIAMVHQIVGVTQISASTFVKVFATVLLGGTVGTSYTETISASGGTSPYTFSVFSGALPTGLSLNSSTGVISGTPSAAGTFSFTIKAVDAGGNAAMQYLTITVTSPGTAVGSYGWVA
jgi:large repetitive protein